MKATANEPVHELKAVLAEHLPWHGARIGFLAQFLLALLKVRSVNLAELATGFGVRPKWILTTSVCNVSSARLRLTWTTWRDCWCAWSRSVMALGG